MSINPGSADIDEYGAQEVTLKTASGETVMGQQSSSLSLPVVLSSDHSAIPTELTDGVNKLKVYPDGSIDSNIITEGIPVSVTITNVSQKGKRFSVVVSNLNLGTSGTEYPVLLIRNPAASTKELHIQLLGMNNRVKTQTSIFYVYANPTVTTNGTLRTPYLLTIGDNTTSGMQIYQSPTISSLGTLLHIFGTGANQNDLTRLLEATDIILPNNSCLITANGSNNNTLVDISLEWTEEIPV